MIEFHIYCEGDFLKKEVSKKEAMRFCDYHNAIEGCNIFSWRKVIMWEKLKNKKEVIII